MEFCKISDIRIGDERTWNGKIFLTFDIECASDGVLLDTIELIEKAGVPATWFVIHNTPLLTRLRDNPNFELGIHPNFNKLLQGDFGNGANAEEVVDKLLTIVPEAKSVRSHSQLQSTRLLEMFSDKGLYYDCNHFIPIQSGIELTPWYLMNDLIKVPFCWEDDLSLLWQKDLSAEKVGSPGSLKVVDFHPIHIFLNTENLQRYEEVRYLQREPKTLIKYRYKGIGIRMILEELLSM